MRKKLSHIYQLSRYFGTAWLFYRLGYAIRQRSGFLQFRMPATDWDARPLRARLQDPRLADPGVYLDYRRTEAPGFFFSCADRSRYLPFWSRWDGEERNPVEAADEIEGGVFPYFGHLSFQTGFPPDWHQNPLTGEKAPRDLHWSRISDFDHGDIKFVWEPNRFRFTYTLVRAYWRTGDERYAELFWQLVEDWRMCNLPQQGANWKCGQETSFRVMAWCFGFYGFLNCSVTTTRRVVLLAQMIAVSGQRIEANVAYALSQRNNHGISEGLGLWTIGLLFPEFRHAGKWRVKGREILERLGRELIYDDGSFCQHSANYQRLMLHDYLWGLRLAELNDQPFSQELQEHVGRAYLFLYQLQDEETGELPCYGQNDGALILPLNNCDSRNFRPVLQAASYSSSGVRCYHEGPWDEDLLWLFGPEALEASVGPPSCADLHSHPGGCYTLRSDSGFSFTRCVTFQDRPSQADMLHLDLWWRGQNIALDAGTFSYNGPEPWNNPLAGTAYHNTVMVDNRDQMERVGRFLWLPWLQSRVCVYGRGSEGLLAYWEGTHNGYQRLPAAVTLHRGILRIGKECWLVLDRLFSHESHSYRLHWLLLDCPYEWRENTGSLALKTPAGPYGIQSAGLEHDGEYSLVRADEESPRGWRAPYYGVRKPALSLALEVEARTVFFWTLFAPKPAAVKYEEGTLRIASGQWNAAVRVQTEGSGNALLLRSAALSGSLTDQLDMTPCASS